jgi:hypothetical protein
VLGQHIVVVVIGGGGGGGDIHLNTNPLCKRQSQSKICGLNTLPLQIKTCDGRDRSEMAMLQSA